MTNRTALVLDACLREVSMLLHFTSEMTRFVLEIDIRHL
jgi:hypothetical protein